MKKILFAISLACGMAVVTSCQKSQHDFLDTVPASARFVASCDVSYLLKMAGCESENGEIAISPDIHTIARCMGDQFLQMLQTIAKCGSWTSLDSVVFFQASVHSPMFATMPIKEAAQIPDLGIEREDDRLGNVRICRMSKSASLLYTDEQAWVACVPVDSMQYAVGLALQEARTASIRYNPRLYEFLLGPQAVKACVNLPYFPNPFGNDFNGIYVSADINDRSIRLVSTFCYDNRRADPFADLTYVDMDALASMPGAATLSAAVGLAPAAIDEISVLTELLPLQSQITINAVKTMISDDGGTVAVSLTPGGNNETIRRLKLDDWLIRYMLPFGEKSLAAEALFKSLSPEAIWFEANEDYLAITNYDPQEYAMPGANVDEFDFGPLARMTVEVPYKSETMKAFDLSNGYDLKAEIQADSLQARLRILGPSHYILPMLTADIAKNIRKWQSKK